MSIQLIEALEKAVAAEELATAHMPDASVRVQFAAGDWHKVCEALKAARDAVSADQATIARLTDDLAVAHAKIDDLTSEKKQDAHVPESVKKKGAHHGS